MRMQTITSRNEDAPEVYSITSNNYPNHFNPETTFSFSISQKSEVKLVVYNMKGQKVNTLADNEEYEAGNHEIVWRGTDSNGKKVGSGVYFYRLDVNGKNIDVKKCIMLK